MKVRFPYSVPRRVVVDAMVVLLLFAAASWWGGRYVKSFTESGRQPSYYQSYFEPAVMLACGRGFTVAQERPGPVDDFLRQRIDTLDCTAIPSGLAVDSEALYQYAWFYLMVTVGAAWKVLGVSWSGLAPLFGTLFGLVIALAYGLFRVAVPPLVAVVPAIALIISPLHLQNLPHLRDYAKAPFVLALILILLWMVTRPVRWHTLLGLAALYGAVMGVGYGFRTDLLANMPPLVIAVLLFLPGRLTASLGVKAGALVLAFAMFTITSWPATSFVSERGGCQWHVLLLGLDDGFTHDLGVAPAYYGWMSTYSDEYVHTAVNSYRHRMTGAGAVEYCSVEYDAASAAYLRDIHMRFPADVLTRALASVIRVLDLPFYWWYTGAGDSDTVGQRGTLGRLLVYVAGTARMAALASVVLIGAHNFRLGLFALCVVLYFGGYPSLQFSNRHYFHLEFLGWWALAFLGWHAVRWLWQTAGRAAAPTFNWQRLDARMAGFTAVTAAIVLLPFPLVRAYHDDRTDGLARSLLDAPRVEVPMEIGENGTVLRPVPGTVLAPGDDPTRTAYLDVHVDLSSCPEGIRLGLLYDPAAALHDFSGPVRGPASFPVSARVLMPVYQNFQGISLGGAPASCIRRVERLASVAGVPLLPVLTLPPDWGEGRSHQSFKWSRWFVALRPLLPVSGR